MFAAGTRASLCRFTSIRLAGLFAHVGKDQLHAGFAQRRQILRIGAESVTRMSISVVGPT